MTDDQTYEDMAALPRTRALIGGGGTTFTRAYVSYPLCCPSRATFLTGQYAHNNGVHSTAPPDGGVESLNARHTLPVWLKERGYDTTHIGKYLNGYGLRARPDVPPGWTDWHAAVDKSTYQMWGYTLNENGALRTYGEFDVEDPSLYQTDVLAGKAVEVVRSHDGEDDPFFLSLNFLAPHGESVRPGSMTQPYVRPAPRHVGRFATLQPGWIMREERDVSDKPPYVRALRRPSRAGRDRILADFRARRESLLAVDEAVESIVRALQALGELDSTYILFTSDNGFFQGEHRIAKGKYLAYEPSTHVPLLIRGPRIPAGGVSRALVANTDLAATVLDVTGAEADHALDGFSLLPFARRPGRMTRRPVLHEGLVGGGLDRDLATERRGVGVYYAVRTSRYLYVKWRGGARELYDLRRDPNELRSVHSEPRYAAVKAALSDEVARLRRCRGAECLRAVRVPRPLPLLAPPRGRSNFRPAR